MEQSAAGNAKKEKLEVLAPFASLEDLSPEQESPLDEKFAPTLPEIPEEHPKKTMSSGPSNSNNNNNNNNSNSNNLGISTPRIDISRASSSSHQDDSSPERELFADVPEKNGSGSEGPVKLGLGFTEEMAAELRSSTEELDFQDPVELKRRRSTLQTQQAIFDGERKDSACSVDIGFLSISGRQSRLSSIGSGGSAASAGSHYSATSHYSNASHISGTSHLSATSNISKASRGSSPHRMLVETSFCGPKPTHKQGDQTSNNTERSGKVKRDPEESENELKVKNCWVGRSHSTSSADNRQRKVQKKEEKEHRRHRSVTPKIDDPKTQRFISLFSEEQVDNEAETDAVANEASAPRSPPKFDGNLVQFVSLHEDKVPCETGAGTGSKSNKDYQARQTEEFQKFSSDIKYMKPFTNKKLKDFISQKNVDNLSKPTAKHKTVTDFDKNAKHLFISLHEDKIEKLVDFPSAGVNRVLADDGCQEPTVSDDKPIQIDNKTQIFISLHEDPPECEARSSLQITNHQTLSQHRVSRPSSVEPERRPRVQSKERDKDRNRERENEPLVKIIPLHAGEDDDEDSNRLRVINYAAGSEIRSLPSIPLYSLDIENAAKVYTLDLNNYANSRPARSMSQLRDVSRTPSPAGKSNFFRRNSESAKGSRHKESGSRSRKSSVFGFFKRSNSIKSNKSRSDRSPTIEPCTSNVDLSFKQSGRYEGDTIIIPLHSPDSVAASDLPNTAYDIQVATIKPSMECDIRLATEFDTPSWTSPRQKHERSAESPSNARDSITSDDHVKGQQNITTTAEIVTYSEEPVEKLKIANNILEESPKDDVEKKDVSEEDACNVAFSEPKVVESTSYREEFEPSKSLQEELIEPPSSYQEEVSDTQEQDEPPSFKEILPEKTLSKEEVEDPKSKSSESGSEICQRDEETGSITAAATVEDDIEKKSLVNQPDSLEDELPYVPTTLPQERYVGLPIIPVKQRAGDLVKTCPIERPRSTTPITPASLDMYVASSSPVTSPMPDKMLIVLPGMDPAGEKGRLKSPSQANNWREFSEPGFPSSKDVEQRETKSPPPPPLPPRMAAAPVSTTSSSTPAPWVSFEEIVEKRRSPKKITTLPTRHIPPGTPGPRASRSRSRKASSNVNAAPDSQMVYNYVNPEDCSCECHDSRVSLLKNDS